jgi:glycosyltransferase involved in cell wall biosynthesis
MTLADRLTVDQVAQADLVLATSMTDLATLKGLVPAIAGLPCILYFHENQFAFPSRQASDRDVAAQLTSIYSALAATQLVFNSVFNRDTFFAGAKALLRKMPDGVPAGVLELQELNALVLPVPLPDPLFTRTPSVRRPDIVWNHRWEHDKGPERLLEIVQAYVASGLPGKFHLVGQQFRTVPPAISEAIALLKAHQLLGAQGYIESVAEYHALLAQSEFVLSTADHEFQGLAVMEAMALGCLPVVPDALVYPEYVPAESRYTTAAEAVQRFSHPARYAPSDCVAPMALQAQTESWRELFLRLV